MLSIEQLRAARSWLNLSQQNVADSLGFNRITLQSIESGETKNPKAQTLADLKEFYESSGLEFTETGGIRPNNSRIREYKGDAGFQNFYDDIYNTVKDGGTIAIQNGMPSLLIKHLGQDFYDMHSKRMSKLSPDVRVLIKSGDDNLIGSSFANYRTVEDKHFTDQMIYIYGDKVGFITFGEEVEVLLIDNQKITRAQRNSFEVMWDNALS